MREKFSHSFATMPHTFCKVEKENWFSHYSLISSIQRFFRDEEERVLILLSTIMTWLSCVWFERKGISLRLCEGERNLSILISLSLISKFG